MQKKKIRKFSINILMPFFNAIQSQCTISIRIHDVSYNFVFDGENTFDFEIHPLCFKVTKVRQKTRSIK